MKNKNAAFTVIAQNYLSYALVLAESMQTSNPEIDFIIYFSDGMSDEIRAFLKAKGIKGVDATLTKDKTTFLDMAFFYEITEYCTAIKPFIFSQLFEQDYQTVCYIDPDICVYQSLHKSVLSELESYNALLTPHICSPITDKYLPSEQTHLKTGTFNLGFVAIKNNEVGRDIALWWSEKCHLSCFNDPVSGLFVDQKWTNLIPVLFDGVFISRHLGLNVAYWNLHERYVDNTQVNKQYGLVFFHFSGFVFDDINVISKYQNRFTLEQRQDLLVLFTDYRSKLEAAIAELPVLPDYAYNHYLDGRFISLLARRFFFWQRESIENPFSGEKEEKTFLKFLLKKGVKERFINNSVNSSEDINKKARIINYMMVFLLKLLGPHRYFSLCKYFGYLGSLNNHQFLLRNKQVITDNRQYLK